MMVAFRGAAAAVCLRLEPMVSNPNNKAASVDAICSKSLSVLAEFCVGLSKIHVNSATVFAGFVEFVHCLDNLAMN